MKIAVFGLGYVGMTAAACLASQGHDVTGIDPIESKVLTVNAGRSPIVEPHLDSMIQQAVGRGMLRAITHADASITDCTLAIVCVGTPSAPDGSHNMGYIAEVTHQIAALWHNHASARLTVVFRSTFRPGTIEDLVQPIIRDAMPDGADRIDLVYNPEFLRESMAVADFMKPPKIVIGTADGQPNAIVESLYAGIDAPVFRTRYREAEITKFVDNAFHALKIAFANEIGRVCSNLGVNAQTVHNIFVSDTKLNISKAYLRPGGAFGGSCLPKDVRALQYIAEETGAETHLVNALLRSNQAHKDHLARYCIKALPDGSAILMLGLAFKHKSDDLRESPNVDLARALLDAGHDLSIFDPYVHPANIVGQNLGALSVSPFVRPRLISQEEMERGQYALVIDAHGIRNAYTIAAERFIDLHALV